VPHDSLDADTADVLEIDEFMTAPDQGLETAPGAFIRTCIHVRNDLVFEFQAAILNMFHDSVNGREEKIDAENTEDVRCEPVHDRLN